MPSVLSKPEQKPTRVDIEQHYSATQSLLAHHKLEQPSGLNIRAMC